LATLGLVLLAQIASFVVSPQTHLALAEGAGNVPASTQANVVLGQTSFTGSTAQSPASGGLKQPQSVAVDRTRNRLYVADTSNNRVLWWNNTTSLTNGKLPDGVLGQPNFSSTSYPSSPTASTLNTPSGVAIDNQGNLAVCDGIRILIYSLPQSGTLTNGQAASFVLGQTDFTSQNINGIGANRVVCNGFASDSAGNLYSGYAGVKRVSIFKSSNGKFTGYSNGQLASAEIGQPNFFTQDYACTQNGLTSVQSLALDSQNRLYIGSDSRITWYNPASGIAGNFSNGQAASGVLGKTNFTDCNSSSSPTASNLGSTGGLAFEPGTGCLWVSDGSNYRLLRFTPSAGAGSSFTTGQAASGVLGQTSFTTKNLGGSSSSVTAGTVYIAGGLDFDSNGQLYLADLFAHRVTRYGAFPAPAPTPVAQPSYFHNLTPTRLYDSRPVGTNATPPPLGAGAGPFSPGQPRTLAAAAKAGLPAVGSGMSAILANITVVSSGPGAGFVTVYPTTDASGNSLSAPLAVNLAWNNPAAATVVSNFATIPVDSSGNFNVVVGVASATLIIDVVGYLSPDNTGAGTGVFKPVPVSQPTLRLYDSRPVGTNPVAPPLGAGAGPLASGGATRTLTATGQLGIPSTASAVIINVSAVSATGSGFFSLYPAGGTPPVVAALTWVPGGLNTLGNLAVVPLSGGQMSFLAGGAGQADILMDVVGYVDTNTGGGSGLYSSLATPARLYDTRPAGANAGGDPQGAGSGPQAPATIRTLTATGLIGIPATARAIIAHITLIDVGGAAFVGYYASGNWPGNSSVNSTGPNQIVGNLAVIPLDPATGTFKAYVGANSLGYIVDVVGYIN